MRTRRIFTSLTTGMLVVFSLIFTSCDKKTTESEDKNTIDQNLVGFWWQDTHPAGMEIKTDGLMSELTYDVNGNVTYHASTGINIQFVTAKNGAFTVHEWGTVAIPTGSYNLDTTFSGGYSLSNNNNSLAIWTNGTSGSPGTAVPYTRTTLGAHVYDVPFGVSPSSLSLQAGQSGVATITNGTQPYTVYSNSYSSVATASISGSTITVNALAAGSTTIQIRDAAAQPKYVYLYVTVTGTLTGLTLSQSSITLQNGGSASVTISGGTTPYVVYQISTSNVASANISGSTLTVNAIGVGNTTITVSDHSSPTKYTALSVTVSSGITSTISGYVGDAVTGLRIASATVTLAISPSRQATTDANGAYSFSNVPGGTYQITASKSGYIDQTTTVVLGSSPATQNFALSPVSSGIAYRIVLTWGATPNDLDAHLLKGTYHIYFVNTGYSSSAPYATLDQDKTTGYGPETITIYQLIGDNCKYYVNNYSETPAISTSGAQVNLYSGSTLIKTYSVPTNGTNDQIYWYIFDISSSGTITDHNTLSTSAPTP